VRAGNVTAMPVMFVRRLKALITVEGSCTLPNSGLKPEDFDNLALKGDIVHWTSHHLTLEFALRRVLHPLWQEGEFSYQFNFNATCSCRGSKAAVGVPA